MKNIFPTRRHSIALWIIQCCPQIQMIALCNSRAMGNASEESDIDLFIVTKKGNLWTGRFLTTVITTLLNVGRRNTHGLAKGSLEYIKKTKNKFCLSFFITEEHLNLTDIRLQPDDPYLDKWIQTLQPFVNKENMYERFMAANHFKNEEKKTIEPPCQGGNQRGVREGTSVSVSFFEKIIKKLWLPKTLQTYEKLGRPWGVVISSTMLKFHDNDKRKFYRDSKI